MFSSGNDSLAFSGMRFMLFSVFFTRDWFFVYNLSPLSLIHHCQSDLSPQSVLVLAKLAERNRMRTCVLLYTSENIQASLLKIHTLMCLLLDSYSSKILFSLRCVSCSFAHLPNLPVFNFCKFGAVSSKLLSVCYSSHQYIAGARHIWDYTYRIYLLFLLIHDVSHDVSHAWPTLRKIHSYIFHSP